MLTAVPCVEAWLQRSFRLRPAWRRHLLQDGVLRGQGRCPRARPRPGPRARPHGITANAIAPGPIDTDIMGGTLTEERKAVMIADLLVDRLGTTDDIASAIDFLLERGSGYITGQTLNVDGGLYMQ